MTDIIDGKAIAAKLCTELKKKVDSFQLRPELHAIIVGSDAASKIYVKRKEDAATKVGIKSVIHELPENTSEVDLIALIWQLNQNFKVSGILVQLPLPKHINQSSVIEAIHQNKDVDCFHPTNFGKFIAGNPRFVPCTPMAVIKLLESTNIELKGASALIVGRSMLVGTPTAIMLSKRDATVTIAHSKTRNLRDLCEQAEILVVAVGRPHMIPGSYIQKDAIIIDVGINRVSDKLIVGDVNFNDCFGIAGAITPVPGGVGPMTIACLLENTVAAYHYNGGK
jgi:methylenetetrahydrofolate dehydrogenase (NADP+)/methenyltetrahydrofolate cyclohydrolase